MRRPLRAFPLLLGAALLPLTAGAQTLLINRIVVRVNDRIATMIDFQRQLAERKEAILADPGLPDERRRQLLDAAGRDVLTDIYQELLLLSRADQLGTRATEAEVDKAVAQMRERMELQNDEQFQRALADGRLTEEALRDRLRHNLLVQEVMGREVHPRLRVEEDEMRRYYREHPLEFTNPEAVRLQDVVALEEGSDAGAVAATAREVREALAAGTPAEEVAKQHGAAAQLVDLGWVNAGDLDAELEKAAWALQPNGVTAPVRGRGGLHVVKLLERRAAALRPFDEVKEQIAARLEQSHLGEEYGKYLRELEQRSYITLKVPPEAEGFTGLAAAGEAPTGNEGLEELAPERPAPTKPTPTKPAGAKPATPPPAPPQAVSPPG
jgi:peptidyl-prolyl cis-trans isomerase SurA